MDKLELRKRVSAIEKRDRLIRTSRYMDIMAIIVMACCLIGCFNWILLGIQPRLFGEYKYLDMVSRINFGSLEIVLQSHLLPDENVLNVKFYYTVISTILKFLFAFTLSIISHKMLKPLKEGTVSMRSLSKGFAGLAIAVAAFGMIFSITDPWFEEYFYNAYRCKEIIFDYVPLQSNDIHSFLNTNSPLYIYILITYALGFLSYIFKHGEELQAQVDETL